MKIFSCPEEVPVPVMVFSNFDIKTYEQQLTAHRENVKKHLIKLGYAGKNTGEIVRFQVADGYAEYMVAEQAPRSMSLIHLPYMDGYHYQHVERLTRKDILQEIERSQARAKLFGSRAA